MDRGIAKAARDSKAKKNSPKASHTHTHTHTHIHIHSAEVHDGLAVISMREPDSINTSNHICTRHTGVHAAYADMHACRRVVRAATARAFLPPVPRGRSARDVSGTRRATLDHDQLLYARFMFDVVSADRVESYSSDGALKCKGTKGIPRKGA